MVFSSLPFLLIFMPIFFGLYYLIPERGKNGILFLGSLAFYLVGTWRAPVQFLVFLCSMVLDFWLAQKMEAHPNRKSPLLWCGILFHLFSLGFFKYATFLCGEVQSLFPGFLGGHRLRILLPIGISFYTFQGLSYLIDVKRGTVSAEKSLLCYCVYISMFEQLIAGPIVTYPEVRENLHHRVIVRAAVLEGLGTFLFGVGLKVLIANPIHKLWLEVNTIGFESISTPLAWMAIFAFSFHIYFDFFGYSLMAIGLGKMLGFDLPKNFDFPYLACSMSDFWRRWHITLGRWFREYVYIPLGGNRHGKRTCLRNLLIVWLLTGIWHGAGYNFLLWGLLLFLIIAAEKFGYGAFLQQHPTAGHLYMLLLIPLMWAVFEINDLGQMALFFTRLFPFFGQGPWSVFRYDFLKYGKLYFPFFLVSILFSTHLPYNMLKKIHSKPIIWSLLSLIFVGSLYCMYRGFNDPFLYFRF